MTRLTKNIIAATVLKPQSGVELVPIGKSPFAGKRGKQLLLRLQKISSKKELKKVLKELWPRMRI